MRKRKRKIKTVLCPHCGWLGKLIGSYFHYTCSCGNNWLVDAQNNIIQEDKAE